MGGYASGPFDRHLRDINTACQHIAAQEKALASVGSLPALWVLLASGGRML